MKTCPACNREFDADISRENLPFCSERCRLIDLGSWLTEKHKIAGNEIMSDFSGMDDGDEPTRH